MFFVPSSFVYNSDVCALYNHAMYLVVFFVEIILCLLCICANTESGTLILISSFYLLLGLSLVNCRGARVIDVVLEYRVITGIFFVSRQGEEDQ